MAYFRDTTWQEVPSRTEPGTVPDSGPQKSGGIVAAGKRCVNSELRRRAISQSRWLGLQIQRLRHPREAESVILGCRPHPV